MKIFTRQEKNIVAAILLVIFIAAFFNYQVAIRRGRDNQRKNDMGDLANALGVYKERNGFYPLSSEDGKIKACLDRPLAPDENLMVIAQSCEWGKDQLGNVRGLPHDPQDKSGVSYHYISNGNYFQVFGALEGDEAEYDQKVVNRNISCGKRICNFGKASDKTPLDISIEEYENILSENAKKKP